jgi:hypothetical protein
MMTFGSHQQLGKPGIPPDMGLRANFGDLNLEEDGRPTFSFAEGTLYRVSEPVKAWYVEVDEDNGRSDLCPHAEN